MNKSPIRPSDCSPVPLQCATPLVTSTWFASSVDIWIKNIHFFIKAWYLVQFYSLGPWTFTNTEPSQKGIHFTSCHNLIMYFASYFLTTQMRWCLPLCFYGQWLQWYHIHHHKLFRWSCDDVLSDTVRRKLETIFRWEHTTNTIPLNMLTHGQLAVIIT